MMKIFYEPMSFLIPKFYTQKVGLLNMKTYGWNMSKLLWFIELYHYLCLNYGKLLVYL